MSEKPEIVLLPGLDGTGEMFARLAGRLERHMHVTVVRYPDDASFGYPEYVAFAKGIVGSRRVFLLGESFSGPVSIAVARELGDQVQGLLLSATFVQPPWPSWLIRRAATVDPTSSPPAIRDWVLMGRHQDAGLKQTVQNIVERLPLGVRRARLLAVAGVDSRDDFARLKCPVLALHGTGDWLVTKRSLARAIATKRSAAMTLLPAAHMLLQTHSEQAAERILAFVSRIKSSEQRP